MAALAADSSSELHVGAERVLEVESRNMSDTQNESVEHPVPNFNQVTAYQIDSSTPGDQSIISEHDNARADASGTGEDCCTNQGRTRNILRGLLSQQLPPEEPASTQTQLESVVHRFSGIVPFLPNRNIDFSAFAHRPRCQSVDANLLSLKEPTRTPSRDSLDCMVDVTDADYRYQSRWIPGVENQIELTRNKLMQLTTECGGSELDLVCSSDRSSSSQPGTPPRPEAMMPGYMHQHRKYSEGSQLKALRQALRMGFHPPGDASHHLFNNGSLSGVKPVDLSSRRRRRFEVGLPYSRRVSIISPVASNCSVDEGIDDDTCSESSSILKSILTGRERSNTISVCGLRAGPDPASDMDSRRFYRQPVTLAKKNLHPVSAKISDCLSRIVSFTKTLQDFCELPAIEQRTLMGAALPRLLLLFMAESNVHFVVAPVLQRSEMDELGEDTKEDVRTNNDASPADMILGKVTKSGNLKEMPRENAELPTLQFAECVKNFVSRCQSLAVSPDEYHYMRVIALFQSAGTGAIETANVADRANAAARHDLQHLVEQTHPGDPLQRYSALLMLFHSLFSINSNMLESLFCHPLSARNVSTGLEFLFR